MNFDLLLVQNYDLFRRFDAHFVSGADLEKYWADDSHIAHTCSLRSIVVPFHLVNRGRWLDHYYKTKCVISGENAS